MVGREFNLGSPKQLQEILFDELEPAEDQADQDRLHHRRRRAAEPVRADRSTRCWRTCCATATWPSSSPPSTACSSRSATTAASTPPSSRPSRPPAGCPAPTPTCRTSRSAPRRAGASGARSSSARASRRLLTADYSQIEMRIMAHLSEDEALIEAFNSGFDFHAVDRVVGVRRPGRRGRPRPAPQDQGDELRPGLRPVRLRPVPAARHHRRPRPRSSWRSTSPRFGGVRDYLRRSSRRPAATATPRRCWAAAATCPTSTATTGSAARWPSGWPSTPRSRARPPTSSRSPCCSVDAALRAAGLRSRMLLQVHDELVFEVAPGEREAAGGAGARADGRAPTRSTSRSSVSVGAGRDWNAADH